MIAPTRRLRLGRASLVVGLLAVVWTALTGGSAASWLIGLPLIGLATALAMRGAPAIHRISPGGLLRFVPFFLGRVLGGGLDVARRALDPRLPIQPGFLSFRLRVTDEAGIALVSAVLNLQPGTVSVRTGRGRILIHAIDATLPVERQVRQIEDSVARLLGIPLRAVAR